MRIHESAAILLAAFVAGWVYGEGASSEATSPSTLAAIAYETLVFVPTDQAAPPSANPEDWTRVVLGADGWGEVQGADLRPLAEVWFASVPETP